MNRVFLVIELIFVVAFIIIAVTALNGGPIPGAASCFVTRTGRAGFLAAGQGPFVVNVLALGIANAMAAQAAPFRLLYSPTGFNADT